MSVWSRRRLLGVAAAGAAAAVARRVPVFAAPRPDSGTDRGEYEPWLEIDAGALRRNVAEVSRLVAGRPVFAVVKNNGYGLGLETVGPLLDPLPTVAGLAVVKADEAFRLRDAGVHQPVLVMGLVSDEEALELARRDVRLAPFAQDAGEQLARISRRLGRSVPVHLYLDTGMNRLGMPYYRAGPWIRDLAARREVTIEGTFMSFTEDLAFDPEQLQRFRALAHELRGSGVQLGKLHAASSHGLFFRREAYLDMVRPGLVLYGAYPSGAAELELAQLAPAFRLKARVVDVQQLRTGDSASYDRAYTASKPTWIAILPAGHADGYPRGAVTGCQVLIRNRLYPVIAAVSASHTIVEVGDLQTVEVGDEATLVGPDRPEITPNAVAQRAGVSVYDVLMHLSALLPKRVVQG
ncbi:MAG: alanine racemase [Gemmatimonadetes bacterium]|nr:alanine racemase [Gemmatimonadota bacterium]